MKNVEYIDCDGLPAVIIDNIYSSDDYNEILSELNFFKPKMFDPSQTGSASNDDGKLLKKNRSLFLDGIFQVREASSILTKNRRIFNQDVISLCKSMHPFFSFFDLANQDTTLISYYEDTDYYDTHYDHTLITCLTWIYETPKSFSGGDLILGNKIVECRENRTVIFPGILNHRVTEITDCIGGKGRFTISQFLGLTLFQ